MSLVLSALAGSAAAGQVTSGHAVLSLHEAIQASEDSPQAHEGQDRIDAARGSVLQAGLRPNPRLYLQSEDLRPWADNFDFPNETEDYAYLGQLFELGGKRARRLEVTKANVRQAEADRSAAESTESPAEWLLPTGLRLQAPVLQSCLRTT